MADVTMSVEDYLRLVAAVQTTVDTVKDARQEAQEVVAGAKKVKRKASAYSRKYKAAFKRVASRYKKKNGQWKANGFRAAVRAAHKEAKK